MSLIDSSCYLLTVLIDGERRKKERSFWLIRCTDLMLIVLASMHNFQMHLGQTATSI